MTLSNLLTPPLAPLPSISQGIRFNSYLFTEPRPLGTKLIVPTQGVYAILVADATCKPRPFRVLYFGESENLNTRVCDSHEKHADWKREACGLYLHVGFYVTPGKTTEQRNAIERELIATYNPPCNIQLLSPLSGLAAMLHPLGGK